MMERWKDFWAVRRIEWRMGKDWHVLTPEQREALHRDLRIIQSRRKARKW